MSGLKLTRREFFLLAVAARTRAADRNFWNTKPSSQWTAGEIYELRNHSPWAAVTHGSDPSARGDAPIYMAAQGGVHYSNDGMPVFPPPATPGVDNFLGPPIAITWESARPLRDAGQTPLPAQFAGCYVIGLDGVSHVTDAILHLPGKQKRDLTTAVTGEILRTSTVLALGFPKTGAPVHPSAGDIVFHARSGRWIIEHKFRPKDMFYRGRLAV